jgi:hypothetical protein
MNDWPSSQQPLRDNLSLRRRMKKKREAEDPWRTTVLSPGELGAATLVSDGGHGFSWAFASPGVHKCISHISPIELHNLYN